MMDMNWRYELTSETRLIAHKDKLEAEEAK